MKHIFLAALLFNLTACGTDEQYKSAPDPIIVPMTLADFKAPDFMFFNEERTTVVEKQMCAENVLFRLEVEATDIYILASKASGLDHVYRALNKSIGEPIICQ